MKTEDVTIIGAGPGGIATAIQLKRWGLEPLVLERNRVGGLLINAHLVENYPGFPEGISGPALVELFGSQLERFDVRVEFEEVLILEDADGCFEIRTRSRAIPSRVAVVASGTKPRLVDTPQIPAGLEGRVFHEVHPIANIDAKTVAILGAGDAAFDYALNLARKNSVIILNRGSHPRCLPLLWARARHEPAIRCFHNTSVTALRPCDNGVTLSIRTLERHWELGVDYVLFAVGRIPRLDFLSSRLKERMSDLQRAARLYLVGDVKNEMYRQVSIAVGDGVHAAMKICETLQGAC